MTWDLSRYNVVVKQVEGVSDVLAEVRARIEPEVGRDRVARFLVRQLKAAQADLDKRALTMLAAYDPVAAVMLRAGIRRDPRRRLGKVLLGPARSVVVKGGT